MNTKLGEITELINALFNATLSAEVASELTQYVGHIAPVYWIIVLFQYTIFYSFLHSFELIE